MLEFELISKVVVINIDMYFATYYISLDSSILHTCYSSIFFVGLAWVQEIRALVFACLRGCLLGFLSSCHQKHIISAVVVVVVVVEDEGKSPIMIRCV